MLTMIDFLTIAITFPALPFTVAVAASTAFWLFSLATGLDFGLEGVEGAVEGPTEAAVDGAVEADVDPGSGFDGLALVATVFRIGKVPITLWLSLFTLWGWVVAFVGGWLLRSPLLVLFPAWPGNIGALLIATVAGVVFAAITSRPFEPLYRNHGGRKRESLVGEVAEITTSRVDDRFGQARTEVGTDDPPTTR